MRGKRIWMGLGTAVLLALITGAIVWFVDPFGWQIQERTSGNFDAAITAIPPDSLAYVGIDLLRAADGEVQALVNQVAAAGAGDVAGLQTTVADRTGLQVPDDLLPWAGQSVGVAVLAIDTDVFGEITAVHWLAAIESRNPRQAAQTVEQVVTRFAQTSGVPAQTSEIAGVTITSFAGETAASQLALAVSGGLVLVGDSADSIEQGINAQAGTSLADRRSYQALLPRLPENRPGTLFVQTSTAADLLLDQLLAQSPIVLPTLPTDGLGDTVGSITVQNGALLIDTYTQHDLSAATAVQQVMLARTAGRAATAVQFPPETLVYLNGSGADLWWAQYEAAFAAEAGSGAFTEITELLSQEFNLNPTTDLFAYLDGDVAVGLFPGPSGLIPALQEAELEGVIAVASSQPETLAANVIGFNESVVGGPFPLGQITEQTTPDGQTLYSFRTLLLPNLSPEYGLGPAQFYAGTTSGAIDALRLDGADSLANTAAFQAYQMGVPASMTPGLFVDVNELVNHLNQSARPLPDQTAVLRLIEWLGTAVVVEGDVQHTQVRLAPLQN